MIGASAVWALAVADFRDRVRRPAYAVTLIAAGALGFFAVPASTSHWAVLYIGAYRGTYTSAYVGTLVALTSVIWLSLAGFYVVRNSIARDESTGVGQLLASTPMRNVAYLGGKLLSNTLVLGSMLGALAVTALVMQLARGEDRHVDPVALLTTFLLIALPIMVLVAAAALAMETIRPLRAGLGNVAWFFIWMVGAVGGQSASAPLGGLGIGPIARSMLRALDAQGADPGRADFSLGLQYVDNRLRTFVWTGFDISAGFVAERVTLVLLGIVVALLPVWWFHRFDRQPLVVPRAAAAPVAPLGPPRGLPTTAPERGNAAGRLLVGEFHILVRGLSWWWWGVAALLAVVALVVPAGKVPGLLPIVWLWPVLVWSRLGTQPYESGLEGILGAYPAPRLRLLAEWAAGVLLTALTGATAAVRLGGDGFAYWCTAVLVIPTLALALGSISRTQRPFQAVYLVIWYSILNGLAAFDFMGSVRRHGHPAGPPPALFLAAAAVLLTLTFGAVTARRRLRP